MSLVFPVQNFGGNSKFLELFGKVAKIFWNFLELSGNLLEQCRGAGGASQAGLDFHPRPKLSAHASCFLPVTADLSSCYPPVPTAEAIFAQPPVHFWKRTTSCNPREPMRAPIPLLCAPEQATQVETPPPWTSSAAFLCRNKVHTKKKPLKGAAPLC
jgi:hypothetical protein